MADPGNEKGAKKGKAAFLEIDFKTKPVAEVGTSAGVVYLYPLRISDLKAVTGQQPSSDLDSARRVISRAGSLVKVDVDSDRQPLGEDGAGQLTDDEIEELSKAFTASSAFTEDSILTKASAGALKRDDESESAFLVRLIKEEVRKQAESLRNLGMTLGRTSADLIEEVRKNTTMLGSSLTEFDRRHLAHFDHRPPDTMKPVLEAHAKRERERAEELDMVRLTGQMTAQSAKTLQSLAEAAATLMTDLDERDRQATRTTRIQLWIAVVSVVLSVVFSFVALLYAAASYREDRVSDASNDSWREKILSTVRAGKEAQEATARDINGLAEELRKREAAQSKRSQPGQQSIPIAPSATGPVPPPRQWSPASSSE